MSILTHTNNNYVAHDVDNVALSPQPAANDAVMDAAGWTSFTYKDFNGNFVRHLVDNSVGIVSAYQAHDVNNTPIVRQPYQRHDISNNPVGGGGAVPLPAATAPRTVEGQGQREDTPGVWIGISAWEEVESNTATITNAGVNKRLRVSTRIQDSVIAPSYITVSSEPTGIITSKMTNLTPGVISGIASIGETLTQTEGTIYGGITPYTKQLQWSRRVTGSGDSFKIISGSGGLTYTIQPDDAGYDVRGRTRYTDSFGLVKAIGTASAIGIPTT